MNEKQIHLGYEVGTGEPVSIPMLHTVVTGQTQRAGKTTLLEAVIRRANARAVTFITKRGEGSFTDARRIDPYFKDQGDWEFVSSILEASRGEKLKYERSSMINASKGADTLAQVHKNVRDMLKQKSVWDKKALTCLDAYLDKVVPHLDHVRWANSVHIERGVNAVDLTQLNVEMQHLVIRSTIDWVSKHEEHAIMVIPEAWKFVPQGRGTPVKLAAEEYVRQGAGLHNFMWMDSQDIAGVDKIILKSFPLWILGVQRESNEIERTLDQIPAGTGKPNPGQIAKLRIGQFFLCYDDVVIHVYAQPIWMGDDDARAIARGEKDAREFAAPKLDRPATPTPVAAPIPQRGKTSKTPAAPPAPPQPTIESEDEMSEKDVQEIKQVLDAGFRDMTKKLTDALKPVAARAVEPVGSSPPAFASGVALPVDEEAIYQRFKTRLIEEQPQLIKLLVERPEINLEVEKVTVEMNKSTLGGRLAYLIHSGFCKKPVRHTDIKREMERTGTEVNGGNLTTTIKQFVKNGFLTEETEGFREVEGMKINIVKK